MTEEENGKKRRRFALLLQKQAQRSAELSNRLEGQIALFVDHSSEAVTAATDNNVGRQIGLSQSVFVAGHAEHRRERGGRTTPATAIATTDGLELMISKNREFGHNKMH